MSLLPLVSSFLLLHQIQDSASLQRFREGIPPEPPPIPGGATPVLQALFNAPAWMWVLGVLLVVGAAVFLGRLLWVHRKRIGTWLATRRRPIQLGLAGVLALLLGVAAWGGAASWNYMQYENAFCLGCHIMEGPWNKFAHDAGKHSELKCHDCHQQSVYASTRQLVLWIANRPEKIPPHAKVPSERCESCHATNQSEQWTRIKETAGHRTHLESDSTALADVQCVTCHGVEVHQFIPAKETCGQSGCHDQLEIRLGGMAEQTTLHCNQCHQFTAEVPRLATRDSAAGTLRPGSRQCLACHAMQRILAEFDPEKDPHQGVCGTCHNPHTQETPRAAGATCTTAGCHAGWQAIPFHTGAAHRRTAERCLVCHQPHAARVDASDCVACHTSVRGRFGALRPPLPFDTTRALRPDEYSKRGPEPPAALPVHLAVVPSGSSRCATCHEPGAAIPAPAVADSFSHSRHRRLACLTCHATGSQHGRLTFEPPRGCQICHHQRPAQADCAACHSAGERARPTPLTITIAVRDSAPRPRAVSFAHATHRELRCVQCHTEPVTLAPAPAARACRDCHSDHHTAARSCGTCHQGGELRTAHARDISASHRACVACHTAATVALLTPDRSFCLTCHESRSDHYPAGECSTCHFLASPDELRPILIHAPPE